MTSPIFRSPDGEAEIMSLYDESLSRLGPRVEKITVGTSLGDTHVLATGPDDAPPLIVLSGGNFLNPTCLGWFLPLAENRRVYSPDIIGQPGKSAPSRPSSKGDGHARWMEEVLDGLGIQRAPFVGISYGAGVALRTAGRTPDRVSGATLISPSGFVGGSIPRMLREVALPMIVYWISPNDERLRKSTSPLLTGEDEDLMRQIGAVYRHVKLDSDLPRKATAEELQDFHSPTLVFASENDIFFPGEAVLKRAREIIPNLVSAELLRDCRHIPPREAFMRINDAIEQFLRDHGL
ncbi:MAG: alpha/beta fold hydrolase [Rubrobacter sp.]|nr:alpha/beta fold hydrolase [Rubrobacter sp.]